MGRKTLTAHFFTIDKMVGTELIPLPKDELDLVLQSISKLNLDRNEEVGRYFFDGSDERCLLFQQDTPDIPNPPKAKKDI